MNPAFIDIAYEPMLSVQQVGANGVQKLRLCAECDNRESRAGKGQGIVHCTSNGICYNEVYIKAVLCVMHM
jgi:hypothetical protein